MRGGVAMAVASGGGGRSSSSLTSVLQSSSSSSLSHLLRRSRIIRCSSSSSSSPPISTPPSLDHVSFIGDVAAVKPPDHLPHLLHMLQARGERVVSPGAKEGMLPLVIPLSESESGSLTSLLRWPTSPAG